MNQKVWTNPGPVTRWCPACGMPRVCGRQVTSAARASDMDSTNTWAACPACGTRLKAITNSNNGGMTARKEQGMNAMLDRAMTDIIDELKAEFSREVQRTLNPQAVMLAVHAIDEIRRLRARVEESEAELEACRRADANLNQALNEGDGVYRP